MDTRGRVPSTWLIGCAAMLAIVSVLEGFRIASVSHAAASELTLSVVALRIFNWIVPLLSAGIIVRLAQHFSLQVRPLRNALVHFAGALVFAGVQVAAVTAFRFMLPGPRLGWTRVLQLEAFNQIDWCLMVYASIVSASHAIAYYEESVRIRLDQARLTTLIREAELKSLQTQLEPHFIFNTLNIVSALAFRDASAADTVITAFGDLLRGTFDSDGVASVPLSRELRYITQYVEIQRFRFRDRLSVTITVDAAVQEAFVPRMILFPLVENVIGQLLEHSRADVKISATTTADRRLELTVRAPRTDTPERNSGRTGVSADMTSTSARLRLLYPREHSLRQETHGGAFVLRLEMPLRLAPTDEHDTMAHSASDKWTQAG